MNIKEVAEILRLPLTRIEHLIKSGSLVAKTNETGAYDISETSLVQFVSTYGPPDWCWGE